MKTFIKKVVLLTVFWIIPNILSAQTLIDEVRVNNQTTVTNCNTINFGTVVNNSLTFYYTLTDTSTPSGVLRIYLKSSSSSGGSVLTTQNIQTVNWSAGTYSSTIACSINETDVQVSGSSIYIEFETSGGIKTKSCEYPIIKTPTPSFTLSPTTLSLACGNISARTFTVTPANIPSGASVTYSWSYNNWSGPSSSSSSITLTPSSATSLPSSVTVTPFINGVAQPTRTCTVTRTAIGNTATMTGPTLFCTSSSFSLSGVLANQTVTWSLSNTTAATISATTGTAITVTSTTVGGDVTLTARVSNACGQFYDVTKNISIGVNAIFAVLTTPSGNPYIYPYTNAPEGCNVPFYCFTTSSATVNATDTSRQIKFVCNGITVIKQPAAFANAQVFLYASDFGIAEGQSFSVSAFYGNSCGFVGRPRVFALYRPTQCQCGIGAGCLQLPRVGGLVASEVFNAQAYPNPFGSHFTLDIESSSDLPVDIKVYDMIGRQIEARKATVSELSILEIGSSYPIGLYNVLLSQGEKVKSVRIVKR